MGELVDWIVRQAEQILALVGEREALRTELGAPFPLPGRAIPLLSPQRVSLLMTLSHVSQAALVRCDLELLASTTKGGIVSYRLSEPPLVKAVA